MTVVLGNKTAHEDISNVWFGKINPLENEKANIICLPYAGGGSLIYKNWLKEPGVSDITRVCPVQLPGREARIREPFAKSITGLSNLVAKDLISSKSPTVIFGHSMGALIAFELAHSLRKLGFCAPLHLVVSGSCPPHIRKKRQTVSSLDDQALTTMIKEMQSENNDALDNPELAKIFIPILRADFEMCDSYEYTHDSPLDIPITAMSGVDDHYASPEEMLEWTNYTSNEFKLQVLPGNHFFIDQQEAYLVHKVSQIVLSNIVSRNNSNKHSSVN